MPAVARVARVFASCALTRLRSGAGAIRRRLAQTIGLVPGDQPVDHRVEIAGLDELGQLVVLEIDPVVGDPSLWIVVYSDLLTSVTGADRRAPHLSERRVLLCHLAVEAAGHEHLFSLRLVLELLALVLAG